MAAGSGMTVTRHRIQMHGKTSEIHHDGRGVFAGLPNPFTAMRYHSLVVLPETIPPLPDGQDGWQVSAWTFDADAPRQKVVMGLRRVWGEGRGKERDARRPLEGVQFHPESFMTAEGPRLLKNFLQM